jgi:hypothetical protein
MHPGIQSRRTRLASTWQLYRMMEEAFTQIRYFRVQSELYLFLCAVIAIYCCDVGVWGW